MNFVLPSVFGVSLFVVTIAAIGSRVLMNFSHRQLELFCRLRKRRELFGRILDLHDEVALAVEKLEALGLILLFSSGTLLWMEGLAKASTWMIVVWFCAVAICLFAITSWIPWAITQQCSAPFLLRTWWFWRIVYAVFWPLGLGMVFMNAVFRRLAGNPQRLEKDEEEDAFEDEIMTMVTAGEREGLLESDARDMIESVIELGDTDVSDIMTPRSRVDALDIRMNWPEILDIVIESGRTRLPVYENTLDTVAGVLYVKDLLPDLAREADEPERSLAELLREPWLIPA
ncbi:MAG: CNNM domain-containing protein, partial [Planctomycetes bacterium]|nr:CNNM domain-containing protein [Planctomycetota bacterium]